MLLGSEFHFCMTTSSVTGPLYAHHWSNIIVYSHHGTRRDSRQHSTEVGSRSVRRQTDGYWIAWTTFDR